MGLRLIYALTISLLTVFTACKKAGDAAPGTTSSGGGTTTTTSSGGSGGTSGTTSTPGNCGALTGTSWVPSVVDKNGVSAGDSNHNDSNVLVTKDTYIGSGLLTGLADTYSSSSSHVITISNISMTTDLGSQGSLSLIAEPTNQPSGVSGSAYPVLVSLVDSAGNELVNVTGCDTAGFYSCTDVSCSSVSSCGPKSPSAYLTKETGSSSDNVERRLHWEQFQGLGFENAVSVNMFPTCNWSSGTPTCNFNSNFFSGGKLRSGGNYTAKYVMLSTDFANISTNKNIGLKLTVLRKRDNNLGIGNKGTVDFNIVLVGDSVIAESRTAKGKQNLSIMMGHVFNHYNVENSNSVNVRIGKITAYEWTCALGGDTFSSTDYEDTGELFKTGSALLSSSSETKAVNLFFVSDIPYSGSGSILGISGAIRGAMINGTTTSGLAVATLGDLANYNPSCTGAGSCPLSSQDADFIDMGSTISHEMGHFLGLNHASESEGTTHDRLPDTPVCTSTSSGSINHDECRTLDTNTLQTTSNKCSVVCLGYNVSSNTFCATAQECQFNHTMWWTTKNYGSSGEGDGNLFSTASGQIINYSPFVR